MILDIMMPFYGRVDQFKTAVRSVLEQDCDDWTLTIVDDRYPDPSAGAWASSLGDERVRYLRNEHNLGISGNFQRCVQLMEHEFAVIMGCDDRMLPEFVRHVSALARRFPSAEIIQPGVEVIDDDGAVHHPLADRMKDAFGPSGRSSRVLSGESLARSLMRATWTYFPSLVWSTATLKRHEFRRDLDVAQDLAILVEIICEGGSILVDPEPVFQYRRHGASVSATRGHDGSKFAEERRVYEQAARRFRALGWNSAARAADVRFTSRLHAARDLVVGLSSSDATSRRSLVRHALGGYR